MPRQLPAVTLREVVGDPEELAALQRVMESDEDFTLRVTGPWRYDKLRSEAILLDKSVAIGHGPA